MIIQPHQPTGGDTLSRANLSVTIDFHGVPRLDTSDAARRVMQALPLRSIVQSLDRLYGEDVSAHIGYIVVYEPDSANVGGHR